MAGFKLADTTFVDQQGWTVQPGTLETIATRAPTHEPYPYHNRGVNVTTNLNAATPTVPSTIPTQRSSVAVARVGAQPVQNSIDAENFLSEPPAGSGIPVTGA